MAIKDHASPSRDQLTQNHTLVWGREKGQRYATGIWTYIEPKGRVQLNHNEKALDELETLSSKLWLEMKGNQTNFVQKEKKDNYISGSNFLDYFEHYFTNNQITGQRNLKNSYDAFKKFVGYDYISFSDIDEDYCIAFRKYLLKTYKGGTPVIYFTHFKAVIKYATKKDLFRKNVAEDVEAKGYRGKMKDILELKDWNKLVNTTYPEGDIKNAILLSLYTGLRFIDVKQLIWQEVKDKSLVLNQQKTDEPVSIPLHGNVLKFLKNRGKDDERVFKLPRHHACNCHLQKWVDKAKIRKKITWHSLRHSLSFVLQEKGMKPSTVAQILGQTDGGILAATTYNRYQSKAATKGIINLPTF